MSFPVLPWGAEKEMSSKCHSLGWVNYQVWKECDRFEQQLTPLTLRAGDEHELGLSVLRRGSKEPPNQQQNYPRLRERVSPSWPEHSHRVNLFQFPSVPWCSCQLLRHSHVMSNSPLEKCVIQTAVQKTLCKITRRNPHCSLIYTGESH